MIETQHYQERPVHDAPSHLYRFHVPKADYFRIFTSFCPLWQTFCSHFAETAAYFLCAVF